jgi:hypothetical protein
MLQFDYSLKMQANMMGETGETPGDEFKIMLMNTNPYLLAITFIVTILHSLFDILAFKNGKR